MATTNLQHTMSHLLDQHGHAATTLALAGMVGMQARYAPANQSQRVSEACAALAKAASILLNLEREEQQQRLADVAEVKRK